MPIEHCKLRTLLFQIRDEPSIRREEHESFVRYSGLAHDQIDILNVFDTPKFSPAVLQGYDALFIGGTSEASVLQPQTYSFVEDGKVLLNYCIEENIPVFASCFGFQMAVQAMGGEIIKDGTEFEMGTIPIDLTEAASQDPLFKDVPDGFLAVSVHQEKALTLPPQCQLLAKTNECAHAFRVFGKPFWAFQFHPEVDRSTLVTRLTFFRDRYTENKDHLTDIISTARETPESNKLVRKFVQMLSTVDPR